VMMLDDGDAGREQAAAASRHMPHAV
jgi:hypothetical protein